ncbi:hypothetical protein AB0C29_12300 [Actinoplanes sp. NPDC048791]
MQPDAYREHIRRVVDEAPPLSEAQRAKLAQLLRPTPSRPPAPVSQEAA